MTRKVEGISSTETFSKPSTTGNVTISTPGSILRLQTRLGNMQWSSNSFETSMTRKFDDEFEKNLLCGYIHTLVIMIFDSSHLETNVL